MHDEYISENIFIYYIIPVSYQYHTNIIPVIMKKAKHAKVYDSVQKGMYLVHDNGSRPYAIEQKGTVVNIYDNNTSDEDDKRGLYLVGKVSVKSKNDFFVGIDPANKKYNGNSCLIRLKKNKYLFIGWDINEITTTDDILKYYSPIGNSDVPYPYAVGKEYTYLMIEGVRIKNAYLDTYTGEDPYAYYYGHDVGSQRSDGVSAFKKKTLVARKI